jgi:hypothetical protein
MPQEQTREFNRLIEFLSGKEAVVVTEPSEGALELVRIYFDKGVAIYERL